MSLKHLKTFFYFYVCVLLSSYMQYALCLPFQQTEHIENHVRAATENVNKFTAADSEG